jgi:hypothetical protein
MSERKLAPHVARAIGVAQAKSAPAPAGRLAQPGRPAPTAGAAHVVAGVAAAARRVPPAAPVQAKPAPPHPVPGPAPHLKNALAALPRPAAPAASPPRQQAAAPPAKPATVQRYMVLGADKIWNQIPPEGKPWDGYPFILTGNLDFAAQQRKKDRDESGYLKTGAMARLVMRGGRSIRLSDDYQMAIEDSDLKNRQPKAIFLSDAALLKSKSQLKQVNSPIKLVPTGRTITVIGGWWSWSNEVLREVAPTFGGGSPNQLPQNCDAVARRVTAKKLDHGGPELETQMLKMLGRKITDAVTETDLRRYARGDFDGALAKRRLNQSADPEVGEAYLIGSLYNQSDLYLRSKDAYNEEDFAEYERLTALMNKKTLTDYSDDSEKLVPWPYHYGAVVAVSGSDRITLENYARGDDRREDPDPRWFFQMYGAKKGQSFHEFHRGDFYANPLTMVAGRP